MRARRDSPACRKLALSPTRIRKGFSRASEPLRHGQNAIINAMGEKRLSTVEEVGQCLKAGTNCGSCIPELKALLRQAQSAA